MRFELASLRQIGIDIETQIEEGELFDFDVECEPVLEARVKAFGSHSHRLAHFYVLHIRIFN